MTVDPERLEDLMSRYGFSEKEARAFHHLDLSQALLREIYLEDKEYPGTAGVLWEAHYGQHFKAIGGLLARQSARRVYPDGWGGTRQGET